mmetsp:Transcript_28095/g.45549  ORF Transcript_28095/g.45549 Transcript_28095/m.45549 type:complete len:114 (-) Transcript_28095:554-895(-)
MRHVCSIFHKDSPTSIQNESKLFKENQKIKGGFCIRLLHDTIHDVSFNSDFKDIRVGPNDQNLLGYCMNSAVQTCVPLALKHHNIGEQANLELLYLIQPWHVAEAASRSHDDQ